MDQIGTRKRTHYCGELRAANAGVIIAIMGRLTEDNARQLAICRTEGSQAIALLLAVGTWADHGRALQRQAEEAAAGAAGPDVPAPGNGERTSAGQPDETAAVAAVLRAYGWHVVSVDASTPLDVAWQRLPRSAEMLVPGASLAGHGTVTPGALVS